jgi:YD repeat-containing protein
MIIRDDIPLGWTYDERGNYLTYKDSSGYWSECTYNASGNVLTINCSNGYWSKRTYDESGNELLAYQNSNMND